MSEKIREVEMLVEYDTQKHLEAIKSGDFELYENEYEIVKGNLGLPQQFMELSELEQRIVMFYVDPDFIEPSSGKHTKNQSFISFLACYKDQNLVKNLYYEVNKLVGHDRDGSPLYETVKQPNPAYFVQRQRLQMLATSIWSKSNLRLIAESMRELIQNDGYRDDQILERKILDDALSNERDSYTLQNRKMAMEIKGMKKPTTMQNINVFYEGGGKKASEVIVAETGNSTYQLIPEEE